MRTHLRGRRRYIALALAVSSVVAVQPALAAKKHAPRTRTLTINAVVHAHPVSGAADGSVSTLAGEVADPKLGPGAAIYTVAYPARTFTFVQYSVKGTFRGSGRIDAAMTPSPDGTYALSGPVRVTGGTGAYVGAHGTLTLSGSTTATYDDTLIVTGTVTVPKPVKKPVRMKK